MSMGYKLLFDGRVIIEARGIRNIENRKRAQDLFVRFNFLLKSQSIIRMGLAFLANVSFYEIKFPPFLQLFF